MSDSDSDSSTTSQLLNEVDDPAAASTSTSACLESASQGSIKPLVSPSEPVFTHKGVCYRSVAVLCTPELARQAAKEAEDAVVKVDHLATVPDPVFESIVDWTIAISLDKSRKAAEEADPCDCGRVSSSKLSCLHQVRDARHDLFRTLLQVSRRFYHVSRPKFWSTLDLSAYTASVYHSRGHPALSRILWTKTLVRQPAALTSLTSNQNGPPSQRTDKPANDVVKDVTNPNDTTQLAESVTVGTSPPPRKKRKRIAKVKGGSPTASALPTPGEITNMIVLGSNQQLLSLLIDYLARLSNLQHVFFPPKANLALHHLQSFAANATSTLRTVDHLFFSDNGEDQDSRVEAILTLFNSAPNLERFGVSGKLILDELHGKRLSFVWKLNSRLRHSPTGCLGVGLKQLYLGRGVEITVGFLRSLKESCPRLTKLHIASGVKVTTDATPQGSMPFDLAAFATQWSSLTALSLVSTDTFSTIGTLDTVLKVCPALTHVHVRSDHITYEFFAAIVSELAGVAPSRAFPTARRLSTRQIGSETAASAALVEASKSYKKGDTDLKHRVRHLAITCRLGDVNDQIHRATVQISGPNVVAFALLVLSFEARALEWPNEMGGQRDLLFRAALMINLEHKKQRDHVARDKDKREKHKYKQKDKGKANVVCDGEKAREKGKGKEVERTDEGENDQDAAGEVLQNGQTLIDIDITIDA